MKLKHYTAKNKKVGTHQDFFYTTKKEAQAKNPNFYDFRLIGYMQQSKHL